MALTTSIHMLDNDTGIEVDALASPFSSVTLGPNKAGYTIFAETKAVQSRPSTKWKYRLFTSNLGTLAVEKDYLSTKMSVQDFSEIYVPNKHNILFR
jgi:hypothetical protein